MKKFEVLYLSMRRVAALLIFLLAMAGSRIVFAEAAWIDVRSSIEHAVDNIEGDPRISHSDIVEELAVLYPDKNTEIYLYCRSGGRAGKAVLALQEAGYAKVFNAGGIEDARKARGIKE